MMNQTPQDGKLTLGSLDRSGKVAPGVERLGPQAVGYWWEGQ